MYNGEQGDGRREWKHYWFLFRHRNGSLSSNLDLKCGVNAPELSELCTYICLII